MGTEPEIGRRTVSRGWIAAGAAALVIAVLTGIAAQRWTAAPEITGGTFANDCCGTLTLEGGRMILGEHQSVEFAVREDEAGMYLLPEAYVGAWEDRGFEIDGTRKPVKLRLDRLPEPSRIDIPAATGVRTFERRLPKEWAFPPKPALQP